jgi:hypothetical protein
LYALERLWGDADISRFDDNWTEEGNPSEGEFTFAPSTETSADGD